MGDENQTLRKLIRARKQARPNRQNADSSDTDSSENTAKIGDLAKGENTAEFCDENLANSDTNAKNFAKQNTANLNNQNLDKNPKISRDYDKDPLIFVGTKIDDYNHGYFL